MYPVKSSLVFLVCVLAKVAGWNPSPWNILHSSFNPSVRRLNTRTVSCIRWCCNYQSVTQSQARSLIFLELLSMAVVPRFADGATGGATAVPLAKASRSTHHKGRSSPWRKLAGPSMVRDMYSKLTEYFDEDVSGTESADSSLITSDNLYHKAGGVFNQSSLGAFCSAVGGN